MKLSSYSNNRGSCLKSYERIDLIISDYDEYKPLMLSIFKWNGKRNILPSKLHTTKPIPLSEYDDLYVGKINISPLSFL